METREFVKDEPVAVLELVKALLVLAAFVVPIPAGFDLAVAGVVMAVMTLVQRSKVTPAHDVVMWYPNPDDEALHA